MDAHANINNALNAWSNEGGAPGPEARTESSARHDGAISLSTNDHELLTLINSAAHRWEDDGGALQCPTTDVFDENYVRSAPLHRVRKDRAAEAALEFQSRQRQHDDLPSGRTDWITEPLIRFFKIEAIAAGVLLLAAAIALALTNSVISTSFQDFWRTPVGLEIGLTTYSRPLKGWITDGLMTLFFFVVALELKRELVLGELRNLRFAMLSLSGAIGGMLVPALLFFLLQGTAEGLRGWGTVTATDTAFAIGCLCVLGTRIPLSLRLFILSLAVFDDIGAILIIAVGYGHGLNWAAFTWIGLGLLLITICARFGVRSIPAYFALGLATWYFWDASGIHPTLTGVALGLMTPTGRWITAPRLRAILSRVLAQPEAGTEEVAPEQRKNIRRARTAARESRSPVEQLERLLHPWVAFGVLPVFALANAGVVIRDVNLSNPVIFSTVVALVIGKPLGVFALSWLAIRLGLAQRPIGITWPLLAAGGMLTGIGFTMSLFIAELAYSPEILNDARFGILVASIVSASVGTFALFLCTTKHSIATRVEHSTGVYDSS
jgi:NhaA family Na+:H+ antiporter